MTIKEETRKVYIATDGKEFLDKLAAEQYQYKSDLLEYLSRKDYSDYVIDCISDSLEDLLNFFTHNPPPKG